MSFSFSLYDNCFSLFTHGETETVLKSLPSFIKFLQWGQPVKSQLTESPLVIFQRDLIGVLSKVYIYFKLSGVF